MSTLRASAAEFVPNTNAYAVTAAAPSTNVHPPAVDATVQQLGEQQGQEDSQEQHADTEQWEGDCYDDGFYDELGNWVYHGAEGMLHQQPEVQGQSWQHDAQYDLLQDPWAAAPPSAAAAQEQSEDWSGLSVTTDQVVGLLHTWYPNHTKAMLQQLYEACNYQLQDTLNILAEMEAEQAASLRHVNAACHSPAGMAQPSRLASQPTLEWPTLAAGAAAAAQRVNQGMAQSGGTDSRSWAAVAKKAAAAAAPAAGPAANQLGANSRQRQGTSSQSAAQQVPWVTTGTTLSQEYAGARAEASDYARVRNACFHQATIAYLAGNKALAKELSAKGKQAAQQMFAAHKRASQQIFFQRNAKLSTAVDAARHTTNSSSNTGVIDLHGLHVREVIAELPQQLAALAAQKQTSVNIIVGAGKHTKGAPGPRLLPAVEAILQELGYNNRQPQPGLIRVNLQSQ